MLHCLNVHSVLNVRCVFLPLSSGFFCLVFCVWPFFVLEFGARADLPALAQRGAGAQVPAAKFPWDPGFTHNFCPFLGAQMVPSAMKSGRRGALGLLPQSTNFFMF